MTDEGVFDVLVLGAGISGLVAASVMLAAGESTVAVLDTYSSVGGNHLDVSMNGYTFDVGSFIFQDDSPLLAHFPELLPGYIPVDPSWARLNPQGTVTKYPFSVRDDIVGAGPLELARIIWSAVACRLDPRPINNARDFARHWLGTRFLRRSGLENYMARFCGCPIEQIDLTFAESRMMWIREQTEVMALFRRFVALVHRRPPIAPTNRQLARPREGFKNLYAPAKSRLEEKGAQFKLGVTILGVDREGGCFEIRTSQETFRARRVISTIPLDICARLLGFDVGPLPAVTLTSLFYSFSGRRGFDDNILYNFSHDARWKRLTVYSDFYGLVRGREYFAVEVVAESDASSTTLADAEFRAHVLTNGLFDGDLVLEGSHVLTNAYPIYTGGSADRAQRLVAALAETGIETFGRQGAFRYQPTARVSTQEVENALGVEPAGRPSSSSGQESDGQDDVHLAGSVAGRSDVNQWETEA